MKHQVCVRSWSSYHTADSIRATLTIVAHYAVVADNVYFEYLKWGSGVQIRWTKRPTSLKEKDEYWACIEATWVCCLLPLVLHPMQAFVTVGSTKFDGLIEAIASEDFLTRLSAGGYTRLVVQYGNSKLRRPFQNETSQGVEVITWPFKPNLSEEYLAADLIISHAGPHSVCVRFCSLTTRTRFWHYPGSAEVE